ncbi:MULTISPECIES: TIGR03619 family F420-dependent LLM class oxidoreductase [Mycobacterium]|uniref:F420-dependent methylene-tetrahydromethanopterin reductase n=1 Tax=Mycobacterium intracellulare subsp. chimaera TaxID=222805 RepID=A0A7U5MFG2_MYCIT|nr:MULTISPECIES: TIGR03619 family F420-dependent LLM class oxidoreductase [Mycobacterium]AGP61620.1 bacterial luciferase [Mycobacterium intracellulare subsp. yongonense 05-1390]ARR75748.1 N5,N10-methylenetetrahydromethanopterin reductase-related protein [Mycobacterium intracellulare subsp. yongonense]ARR80905.1 luciferase-like protein [Mycobacterium intracellulare subsp. yongonense]ASL12560.1 F420-dependent methylene-tetrahydromethanopterin reductase [Mycobacterium intracellulare subsp. chimaer
MELGYVSLNTPGDVAAAALGPALESRGFESLWVGEHPQIPVSAAGGFHPALLEAQRRVLDPFLSLATAAATTSTLRLGTAVVLPLERELFTLAKEVATLDQVSAGRLMLGVGVGFRAELEVARPAIAWTDRYRLLGETVGALRKLWSDDEAEYHGDFIDFEPVWSNPKPMQRPHPPLLAAATGAKAIRSCLPWADGWLPGDAAFRDLPTALAEFRRTAHDLARDAGDLDLTIMAWGDPSLKRLASYRDLGFTRAVLGGGRRDALDPSTTLSFLDRYAEMAEELRT